MSGLCARCHYQQPFAPGEEFCADCEAEVQEILEALTRHGEGPTGLVGQTAREAAQAMTELAEGRLTVQETMDAARELLDQPGPFYFCCTPCECGGQCEKCR